MTYTNDETLMKSELMKLYESKFGTLNSFAKKFLKNPAYSEDAVQDTFIWAFETLEKTPDKEIGINALIEVLKKMCGRYNRTMNELSLGEYEEDNFEDEPVNQ